MSDSLDGVPAFSDLTYEDLRVGQRWGPFTETLGQDTSDELRGALSERRPGRSAPLGAMPLLTLRVLRRALDGIIAGGVLACQHFSVVDTLPAAGSVSVDVWVSAQQQRPSGFYTTFTFAISSDGPVRAIVEWMILAPATDRDDDGTTP